MPSTSWFKDPVDVSTKHSVSYICNNLSTYGKASVYASRKEAVFVDGSNDSPVIHKLPQTGSFYQSLIHEVRFCELYDMTVIVVASDRGVEVFDCSGDRSVYQLEVKDALKDAEEGDFLYCQGIAAVHASTQSLLIGTSIGKVLQLSASKDAKTSSVTDLELVGTIISHKSHAICSLDSSSKSHYLASSDISGDILIHSFDKKFQLQQSLKQDEYAATSVRFTSREYLVATYLTGLFRVYSPETFHLHAEVSAHTRAITALEMNEHDDSFATVSEDMYLNVWSLSTNGEVNLESSSCVNNSLLTGVAFTGKKAVMTAAYDEKQLKTWVMAK